MANASFPIPAHRTGRADFPHQMWRATFQRAQCGASIYVALDAAIALAHQIGNFERHLTNRLQGSQELEERWLFLPALDRHFCIGGFAEVKCLGSQLVIDLGISFRMSPAERDGWHRLAETMRTMVALYIGICLDDSVSILDSGPSDLDVCIRLVRRLTLKDAGNRGER